MPNKIIPYTGSNPTVLADALLAQASGILIQTAQLTSAAGSANFYDGGLQGIGAGVVLSSGYTPGIVNDSTSFGGDNGLAGDAALDAVVNTVFQTQSFNATKLSFSFTVTDPSATSVSFDLIFGSEEYPEWVDAFVDVAVVLVNGVNVALFNHDPNHPLSVISPNLAAGYFVDNANGALPTQYDGVSSLLKFVAPIQTGVNTISIAIADTGDGILDSGIFVANMSAGTTPGSGVVSAPGTGSSGSDTLTGTAKAEYFDLQAGDDTVYAGAGDDIVVAGSGNDSVYGGSGADEIKGDAGDDLIDGGSDSDTAVYAGIKADYDFTFDALSGNYSVSAKLAGSSPSDGKDTLVGVEFAKFGDGTTWSLGTNGVVTQSSAGGPVASAANQPGNLFLSGIGGQGQTLTAKVSDVDGVPATGISYSWQADGVDLGVSASIFKVGAAQVGHTITVTAAYNDLLGHAEFLTSTPKAIATPGNGDFAISLLNLKAPIGASVMNPLTTLVQNAIELGVSPNEAGFVIKKALGLSSTIDLQHYDSWEILQAHPNDALALLVEKKLVQVAVMTSLGSDETGMALTEAILLAYSSNKTLNLANTTVIANLLGLDPSSLLVHEIWDRNDTIGSVTATGTLSAVDQINSIWNDMQSGLSVTLSNSISTLSVHVNQAPIGSANALLPSGTEGSDVVLNAADLLSGFTDPEGGVLVVLNLAADHGTVTTSAGNFTITIDAGYSGPVELSYSVMDDQGLTAPATQLFVVKPAVTVINGTAGSDKLIGTASNETLNGFAGKDIMDGGAGIDTMNGGDGSDTYYVRDVGDLVSETNAVIITGGSDYVHSFLSAYMLTANVENGRIRLTTAANLTGNGLNNILYAGTGNNVLDGGAGIDTASYAYGITGATGVTIDLRLATAQATGGSGSDTLKNIEKLIGSANNDSLIGSSAGNRLDGGAGNDSLNGYTGADTMIGGDGSDTYYVDNVGDIVTETNGTASTGGIDLVNSSLAAYMLSANVENGRIRLTTAANLTGNTLSNVLYAGAGNNLLDGVSGVDTVSYVYATAAVSVSLATSAAQATGSSGSDTLKNIDKLTGSNFNDTLIGDANANTLDGLALNDSLSGGGGNDLLLGGEGNDLLIGGLGKDTLTGGAGNDTFIFKAIGETTTSSTTCDVITDFARGQDKIDLSAIDANSATASVNEAFTNFIGSGSAFSAAGQLRINGNVLYGNIDTDSAAEFAIVLTGITALTIADLVL